MSESRLVDDPGEGSSKMIPEIGGEEQQGEMSSSMLIDSNPSVVTYVIEVDDNNVIYQTAAPTQEVVTHEEVSMGQLVDTMLVDPIYHLSAAEGETIVGMDLTDMPSGSGRSLDDRDDLGAGVRDMDAEARRINELTKMYLTGMLPFSAYVQQTFGDKNCPDPEESDSEDYRSSRRSKRKEDPSEAYCKDFDASSISKGIKKRSKFVAPRGSRRVLPPVLSNLLGQANLKYAQDDKNIAAQICEEIIRQVPQAPGPYKLLALIHRDKGSVQLAHHYSLIAAHLSPQNSEEWIQLAETSLELGEKDQALTCLAQAISADRYNPDPRLRQIKLLQSLGETKAAQKSRERMVETLSGSSRVTQRHGRLILLQAKIAAREFHQENNLPRATKIMECAIRACKSSALQDDINLLVELHCEQNENLKGLRILQSECGVVLTPNEPPFNFCYCPDLAPDLRAKLVVFLVRCDINENILSELLQPFLLSNPDDEGDLFLDIVEALMAKKRYREAMVLLSPLVESAEFSRAAVWLTHGECLRNLGDIEQASVSYQHVMQLAPQHVQARLTLSSLLYELHRFDEALLVLRSKDPEPRLLFEEFHYLEHSESHQEIAVEVCLQLLSQYVREDMLEESYASMTIQRRRLENIERNVENVPNKGELFNVVSKACELCLKLKRYSKMKRLAYMCMCIKPINEYKRELEFLCLCACIHAKDPSLGWVLTREVLIKYPKSYRAWNLYSMAIRFPDENKHVRFVIRVLRKDPSNWAAGICYANNCFLAGAYKDALVEYGVRHKVSPSASTAFMIGVIWTHIACQKRIIDRQSVVVQARGYLEEYARLRGEHFQQEIYYNLGRAMHQIRLTELAVHYYTKALRVKPSVDSLDLSREAAYNLALLYRNSGNERLAKKIILDHIVI